MPTVQELILVKTNIGGMFFDAFLRLDHTSKLNITSHPVQTGANISDHAYLEPKQITIEIGMSDVAKDLITNQFSGGWSKSVTAYQKLRELQASRVPLDVLTRLGIYRNMLIETITAPDDYRTLSGLKATITMKEVLVASVQTVKVSANPHMTDYTNRGEVQAGKVQDDETMARQIFGEVSPSKKGN